MKWNDFNVPAAGSTGGLSYNVGACCGDVHDGISFEYGKHGCVVISKESFNRICLAVDEYYHQRCPLCGFGRKR